MFKLKIPEEIWTILEERHSDDEINSAKYYRYGKYIEILGVSYNEDFPKEYYSISKGNWFEWQDIRNNIKIESEKHQLLVESFSLKKNYLFDNEDTLLKYTYQASTHLRRIKENFYELALLLKKAKELFRNDGYTGETGFMYWYEQELKLSKDVVSLLLKRLELVETYPDYKKEIASLPELGIKLLTKKEVKEREKKNVLKLVRLRTIRTGKDIKNYFNNKTPLKSYHLPNIKYEDLSKVIGKFIDSKNNLPPEIANKIIQNFKNIEKLLDSH